MKIRIIGFLSASLLFLTSQAFALQTSDHGIYVGGGVSVTTMNWDPEFDSSHFANQENETFLNTHYAEKFLSARLKVGYQFDEYVSMELSTTIFPTNTWTANINNLGNNRAIKAQQRGADLMLLGMYPIHSIHLSPYIKAGAAWMNTRLIDEDTLDGYSSVDRDAYNFIPAVGAGFIYQFAVPNVALFADFTYYFKTSSVRFATNTQGIAPFSVDIPSRCIYTLGLSYLFAL